MYMSDLSEEEPGLSQRVEGACRPVEAVGVREVTGGRAGHHGG